ncbi:Surfeit locus protein 5 subunit 22 of Mediator complex [Hibiscus syriacus]|uniref:Surfeit locus protein 5 subunit 22 of Mediator complex n=1 Tax=Hibiscus syriacus TaxID=106335 RepID=A0A6A2XGS7_HIBSY|nr:Surfeit locus protein 5 subunit 22 of Mediator complex [Hibiscus syriacus]
MSRGVRGIEDPLYLVCGLEPESICHLFFSCKVVWGVWVRFLQLWNIYTVLPNNPKAFLYSWFDLLPDSDIWKFVPGAVMWTVWKCRNHMVFENGRLDQTLLFFLARYRVASWFSTKNSNFPILLDWLMGDLTLVDLHRTPTKKVSPKSHWCPPLSDFFKVNVDGVVSSDGDAVWINNPEASSTTYVLVVKEIAKRMLEYVRICGSSNRQPKRFAKRGRVSEVSSLLGRAGTVGLGKAVEVLDTLGSNMTNLNLSSGFTSGVTTKGIKISILAFEVANTTVKGVNLIQSLSKENIRHFKEVVFPSEGVQNLISRDMDELLRIAASDKREELKVFLERWYALAIVLTLEKQLKDEAETIIQQLMSLVQYTAFADDLILFCRDSPMQILNIRRVLRIFGVMSGLHLNLSKSSLFRVNMDVDLVKELATKASCGVGSFPMSYLGLPIGTRKNSESMWDPVFQNFNKRLADLDKKRIHWVSWKSVCQPIEEDGLGILDLRVINRVLLGKWIWKFANEKRSLWKELICCKNNVDVLSLSISNAASPFDSWIWKGILSNFSKNDQIGDCLRDNSKIQVGNGKGDGMFSVKACRLSLYDSSKESFEWKKWVWDGLAPPRVQTFLWQICHQKLAVRVELKKRGIPLTEVCYGIFLLLCIKILPLFSAHGPILVQIQTDLLVEDPTRADSFLITSGPKKVIGWSPPPADIFKLNVDGAVTGDGMQGVGPGLPILTELKAIKEGLGFFYSSNWAKKGRLIIESDCKCAVDWILKLQPAPSFFSDLVEDIEALITAKGVVLRWIPRSCNLEADRLAKQGIG